MIASAIAVILIIQLVCIAGLWWATTELKAMQKSTHSVQLVPADSTFQKLTDDTKASLTKDVFENLG
jgi:hypothetical protein